MLHFSARAVPGTLLCRNWQEMQFLFNCIARSVRFQSLCIMPSHVHVYLPDETQVEAMFAVMRAYARWRNRVRGESGPVWQYATEPTPIRGVAHGETTTRYLHLNPCRKRMVRDPVAYPFSTQRDMVGLTLGPVCRPVPDPDAFHARVSKDESVDPLGTLLPPEVLPGEPRRIGTLAEVRAAVSALTRTTDAQLRRRGPFRDLLIAASVALCHARTAEIAAAIGVDPVTVRRTPQVKEEVLRLVERVLRDPRFFLLKDGDLSRHPSWRAYHDLS